MIWIYINKLNLLKIIVFIIYMKKQLFLSHNWGKNILGEDNHEKVKTINNMLTNLFGWSTWFDEIDMGWNLDGSMYKGICECDIALVFLTQKYITKIENNCLDFTNRDNCAKEWNLINMKQKPIIPIALENNLTKTNNFDSPLLAMYINTHFIINLSEITFQSVKNLNLWIIKNFNINPYLSPNLSPNKSQFNLIKNIDIITLNQNATKLSLPPPRPVRSAPLLDLSKNKINQNKLPILRQTTRSTTSSFSSDSEKNTLELEEIDSDDDKLIPSKLININQDNNTPRQSVFFCAKLITDKLPRIPKTNYFTSRKSF